MFEKMAGKFFDIIAASFNFFYRSIFRDNPGQEVNNFFRNFFVSASGGLAAGVIMFVVNIFSGRWLGPVEYGKFALVLSYGHFLIIPMSLGFDTASVRYLSSSGEARRKEIVSTSFWSVLISIISVSLFYFFTIPFWEKILHQTTVFLVFPLLYAIPLALKNLLDAWCRGFQLFNLQLHARLAEAGGVLSAFVVFMIIAKIYTFPSYVIAMSLGLAAFVIVLARQFYKMIGNFSLTAFKQLYSYAAFAILGGIAGFLLFNANRIVIERFLGEGQLGIYVAYYTASIIVISQFLVFFNNVFFPAVSRMAEKEVVVQKLNKLGLIFFAPLALMIFISIAVIMRLYGKEYPFSPLLAILFSLMAVSHFFYTIDMWLSNSEGLRGVRYTVAITLAGGALNVVATILLVSWFGLTGAVSAGVVTNMIFLLLFKRINKLLFANNHGII